MKILAPAFVALFVSGAVVAPTGPSSAEGRSIVCEGLDYSGIGSPSRRPLLNQLVDTFLKAKTAGKELPTQRFWVRINDQRANPWDSEGKKGMTWKLRDVREKVCLVGSDNATNAYQGDTPVDEALPVLCIRRANLAVPEGVDANNFYGGWSGGTIRLTRPVKGSSLTSLQAAEKFVEKEFGDGWKMAEFHDTSVGGWAWWAYWEAPMLRGK